MENKIKAMLTRISLTIAKGEGILSKTKNASERARWNMNIINLVALEGRLKATLANAAIKVA